MNPVTDSHPRLAWHELFKYLVYALLTLNVVLFFDDEWDASSHLFDGSVPFGEIIIAFAASIDTLAWVILLLLFELETYQIPDEKLKPPLSTAIHLLRIACYGFIVYAFYGYLTKMLLMTGYQLTRITDLCSLEGYSLMLELDEYEALSSENCGVIDSGSPVRHLQNAHIIAAPLVWVEAFRLAWVDVINSATWLLVVVMLELDVRLQSAGILEGAWLTFSKYTKYVLYVILFLAAVYWGIKGSFIDFWDAFLWLAAFVFIEMNMFEWREELEEAQIEQEKQR